MSTPLQEPEGDPLSSARRYLQAFELDKALESINHSLKNRQIDSGSDLSIHGKILRGEILLAKGRFLKNLTFPTQAFHQLEAVEDILPKGNNNLFHFIQLLLAQANLQLNNKDKARGIYEKLLVDSQTKGLNIEQIQALNGLAKIALKEKDTESALAFINQSLELLIQHTDEEHYFVLVENYLLQSEIYFKKSDIGPAKNYAERALKICEDRNLKEQEIKAHILLGRTALSLQNNPEAITHLLEARQKSTDLGHQVFYAESTLYIGVVYNLVFHYPKALEYFKLVEEGYKDLLNSSKQILLMNYLGKSYFQLHEEEEAENYFYKTEKLAKQHNKKTALVFCYAYLGVIYARKNDFKKALIYAKKVDNITKEIGQVDGVQLNLINLGLIHSKLEKYNESIKLTSRGIAAAKRMKDGQSEIKGYQIMAEIFRKKKAYKSAVMYQSIYTKFYEDFYQRNDRQKVSEMEHQFMVQQLTNKITELEGKINTKK